MEILHIEHLYAYYFTYNKYILHKENRLTSSWYSYNFSKYERLIQKPFISTDCLNIKSEHIPNKDNQFVSILRYIYFRYILDYPSKSLKYKCAFIEDKSTRNILKEIKSQIDKNTYDHKKFVFDINYD